jgi:hypothetical protein
MSLFSTLVLAQVAVSMQAVNPVLAFPEPGVDDSAAYEGYRTRFVRDAAGNTVQIYINQREGRVVHLWADAANASAGMTIRDGSGMPAPVDWGAAPTMTGMNGVTRVVEYELTVPAGPLELGAFVLASMRLERDFQYQRGHVAPFGTAHPEQPELLELIARLDRLPAAERQRQLAVLGAASTAELRARLQPSLGQSGVAAGGVMRIEQPTFDGRNRLSLELTFGNADAALDADRRTIAVRPRGAEPIRIGVRIATDNAPLDPLDPDDIFNPSFVQFHRRLEAAAGVEGAARLRRLERQIRSIELVGSEQKLMAGLPNYATYFGRDMLMSALMLEPIWTSAMVEHVLASVLRKLNAAGEVSHEEALGGQAIRENAVVYNAIVDEALGEQPGPRADSLFARARTVIGNLQTVRENYHMVDDDFQLAVLAGRYLSDTTVHAERRRAFLLAGDDAAAGPRLARLLQNLAFVARAAAPYARDPAHGNLISFAQRPDGRWSPGSWRDSGAGYGNGRFAMDVNVIWVPQALQSIKGILAALRMLDFGADDLAAYAVRDELDALLEHARDPARLDAVIAAWRGARRHFEVVLAPDEARARALAALADMPAHERDFWQARLDALPPAEANVRFLAVALDSVGRPIPVMSTDPATHLFLEEPAVLAAHAAETLRDIDALMMPYPLGVFVPELGPLVANDVYAAPAVRAAFRDDLYHSPRVVWGREVNLLMLGLARNIAAAYDGAGRLRDPAGSAYVERLRDALARTTAAVDASGLKHNELWSYRIEDGRLLPIRYGASTDIQLWNLTDLAVQFALDRLH